MAQAATGPQQIACGCEQPGTGHASTVEGEVGDADPRMAVIDARRELPAAQIIDAPGAEPERTAEPGRLMRLAERYGLMPAPAAAGR